MKEVSVRRKFPVFTLLMFIFVVVIILASLLTDFKKTTSIIMPLLVAIPGALILLFILVSETLFPQWLKYFDVDVLGVSRADEVVASREVKRQESKPQASSRTLWSLVIWFIGFSLVILLIGFHIAIVSGTVAYCRLFSRLSWKKCVIFGVAVWAATFLSFGIILRLELFPGIVFGGRLIL